MDEAGTEPWVSVWDAACTDQKPQLLLPAPDRALTPQRQVPAHAWPWHGSELDTGSCEAHPTEDADLGKD